MVYIQLPHISSPCQLINNQGSMAPIPPSTVYGCFHCFSSMLIMISLLSLSFSAACHWTVVNALVLHSWPVSTKMIGEARWLYLTVLFLAIYFYLNCTYVSFVWKKIIKISPLFENVNYSIGKVLKWLLNDVGISVTYTFMNG